MKLVPTVATLSLTALSLILVAPPPDPALAQSTPASRTVATKAEVQQTMRELTALGITDEASLEASVGSLDALDDQQTAEFLGRLDAIPGWRELPAILEANQNRVVDLEAFRASRGVAGDIPQDGSARSLERFRTDFLFMIQQFRQLEPLMPAGFGDQHRRVVAYLETVDDEGLKKFGEAYVLRMMETTQHNPEFLTSFGGPSQQSVATKASFSCPSFSCNFSFTLPRYCIDLEVTEVCISDLLPGPAPEDRTFSFDICEATGAAAALSSACGVAQDFVDEINQFADTTVATFNQVSSTLNALPGQIETELDRLASSLLAELEDIWEFLLELAPKTFNDFIGILEDAGINVTSPNWWAGLGAAANNVTCPPEGLEFPGIGVVGTPGAAYTCRKIDLAFNDVFDLIPGDSASFAVKLPAAVAYFPINYFCNCLQKRGEENYVTDTLAFQEFAEDQLDVALSTRASETALQSLIAQLSGSNTTIVATGANLDTILGNSAIVQSALDAQRDFIAETDVLLERLEFERRMLDSDSTFGLLALPAVQGGRLEEVRAVVVQTIDGLLTEEQGVNNASDFLVKGDEDYGRQRWDKAFENYQKAFIEATKSN